ncbi:tripartite tricarboxylate transporter substrate binding protein [Ramlibacter sp. AN1133]|uniref:tripartite tricarboxylate transporter substrate binding protein n=1 Tax=Ramlibacter sp. AN1133 TaxID=3133429 RepID=UPI0030BC01E0
MRWLLAFALLLAVAGVRAVPARVECIAPAKPGGGFDLTCRLVRELLAAERAAVVEVKYLPGGIGAVAFDRAVSTRLADPGTVIAFSSGSLVNIVQGRFGPHDATAVRWLATLGTDYGIVAVRKDAPFASLAALRERLRQDPGGAVFGASGSVGSQDWMKAALLVRSAGRDHRAMRFVSFEGGGQALAALKGGHVDVFCGDSAEAREALAAGEIRVLALLAPHRLPGRYATVPTAREQGVDLVWPTVRGLYMGPAVPERDVQEWTALLRRVLAAPGFAARLRAEGLEPLPLTGRELDAYLREQVAAYRALARELHLRVR